MTKKFSCRSPTLPSPTLLAFTSVLPHSQPFLQSPSPFFWLGFPGPRGLDADALHYRARQFIFLLVNLNEGNPFHQGASGGPPRRVGSVLHPTHSSRKMPAHLQGCRIPGIQSGSPVPPNLSDPVSYLANQRLVFISLSKFRYTK
jgi:hypothetical protein